MIYDENTQIFIVFIIESMTSHDYKQNEISQVLSMGKNLQNKLL